MICGNRADDPGFFTSCAMAGGWKGCRCGQQVEAEVAEEDA